MRILRLTDISTQEIIVEDNGEFEYVYVMDYYADHSESLMRLLCKLTKAHGDIEIRAMTLAEAQELPMKQYLYFRYLFGHDRSVPKDFEDGFNAIFDLATPMK